jgi:hypothetical protein
MKGKLQFRFDWKAMGLIATFPCMISLILLGYCMVKQFQLEQIIPALEMSYPAFAAWWSIFLFKDVLEEEGAEVILCLPIPRWKLGTVRVGFFFLLYLFLLMVMIGSIQLHASTALFLPLFWQLSIESLFFCSFGFLSMMIIKNSGWAFMIVISYLSMQILTKGEIIPFTNIYLFNERIYSMGELANWSITIVLASFVMWVIAQILLLTMIPEKTSS